MYKQISCFVLHIFHKFFLHCVYYSTMLRLLHKFSFFSSSKLKRYTYFTTEVKSLKFRCSFCWRFCIICSFSNIILTICIILCTFFAWCTLFTLSIYSTVLISPPHSKVVKSLTNVKLFEPASTWFHPRIILWAVFCPSVN